jgi:predicted metal-binding protein
MKKIAIFYCPRIQNHTCIACMKCFRGISEKNGEFARHEEDIQLVSLTDMDQLKHMDQTPDVIHLGTCIKMAYEHGNCPMDPDEVKLKLEKKFQKPVIIGTHDYA